MDGGFISDTKVVADGGRDIDARALVIGVFRAFLSEDILPIVGDEGAAILPLAITNLTGVRAVNLDPSSLAN